jgi:hypothetical protein
MLWQPFLKSYLAILGDERKVKLKIMIVKLSQQSRRVGGGLEILFFNKKLDKNRKIGTFSNRI